MKNEKQKEIIKLRKELTNLMVKTENSKNENAIKNDGFPELKKTYSYRKNINPMATSFLFG